MTQKLLTLYIWFFIKINIVHNLDITTIDVSIKKFVSIDTAQNLRIVFQQLLISFPRHLRLYHYENHTVPDLELVLQKGNQSQSLLFNYDQPGTFLRPFADACINVVLLNNLTDFNRFYDIAYNVKSGDIIFIILYLPQFSYYNIWDTARAVLVYQKWNNVLNVIHAHSEKNSSTIDVNTELSNFEEYENNFRTTMDIAYKKCSPFINEEDKNQLNGIEYNILGTVMERLNFSFRFVNYSNIPVRLILKDLNDGKVHMVVGCLSNTIGRNQLVAFTPDFFYEQYSVIYSSRGFKQQSILAIVRPFSKEVWFILLLMIVVVGILIKRIEQRLTNHSAGFIKSVEFSLRSILEQPAKLRSKQFSVRVIMISWILTAMIFSNAFKSKLAATMIQPSSKEPDSITDLLKFDYDYFLSKIDVVFLSEKMTTSFNATFQEIVEGYHDFDNICECISNISKNQFALIGEETVLEYSFWYTCLGNLTKDESASIRQTKHAMFQNGHAWALKKNSPFIKRIVNSLELLKSVGIIQKWYEGISRAITKSNSPIGRMTQEHPLSWNMVFAPFLILGSGLLLACGVLFVEILSQFRKKA